jgi:hypothetical protein
MKIFPNTLRAVTVAAAVWSAGCDAHGAANPAKMTNQCLTVRANQICFIPRTTGELRLSMNDQPGTYGNHSSGPLGASDDLAGRGDTGARRTETAASSIEIGLCPAQPE